MHMPGEDGSLQVKHIMSQRLSQQTPSAPQTPLPHSAVEPQPSPGFFLGWHMWLASQ